MSAEALKQAEQIGFHRGVRFILEQVQRTMQGEAVGTLFNLAAVKEKEMYEGGVALNKKGDIVFHINGKEAMRLSEDGMIFVQGRLADTDKQVVDALRSFVEANMQKKATAPAAQVPGNPTLN